MITSRMVTWPGLAEMCVCAWGSLHCRRERPEWGGRKVGRGEDDRKKEELVDESNAVISVACFLLLCVVSACPIFTSLPLFMLILECYRIHKISNQTSVHLFIQRMHTHTHTHTNKQTTKQQQQQPTNKNNKHTQETNANMKQKH